jgi:hypothetical protein
MNLKTLTFGTLAASTVIFASTVVSPAQAATVTGTLNIDQTTGVNSVTSSGIDFNNTPNFFSVSSSSTDTFAGFSGSGVTISDLPFSFSSPFDFIKVAAGPTFRITGLSDSVFTSTPSGNVNSFFATVRGNFVFGGDSTPVTDDSFLVSTRFTNGSFTDISIEAAPVPTPALLPGLVGMGIAALRKRKSDGLGADLESAEA